ncbi:hypothetical protein [Caryophanon latum]|uniref:Uncharacterized protein n=1 Tax=Caryophanon latum TaxID=33977 RepID=A0A1C0YX14_9BACL|nr:hypothetical protein [Caryophanon latum]OCS91705.1 hypothetical protein A6K76_08215 [Caryophanon latum]
MSLFKSIIGGLISSTSSTKGGGFSGGGGGYTRSSIPKDMIKTVSKSEPKTELGRAIKDIVETTEQTKQEMKDIVIDTARDITGLGTSDKKVAKDTKDQADEIVAKATAKLERKKYAVEKKHIEVKKALDKLLSHKKSLLNTTVTESQNLSILFENTDWASRLAPTFKELNSKIQLPNKNFSASFTGYQTSSLDLIDMILNKRNDKANLAAAKDYLDEAKFYRSEVNYQVEKMNILLTNLDFTSLVIAEESRILKLLENQLKELNTDLTHQLQKKRVTNDEINEAKNLYQMVKLVANTLKEKMFHEDSRITKSYVDNLKQLDSLMANNINSPNTPTLKEYIPLNINIINY